VRFLVDSGAQFTLLAMEHWKALGVRPKGSEWFSLGDGTRIERQVGECHLALPQGGAYTSVILGEPGDKPLLGSVTLEVLGLMLNTFTHKLQPMRMLLA
jgi:predicted aspartyl protease